MLLLLEGVGHVDNVQGVVRHAARHLEPGGPLLAPTINRTARSFAAAGVGAEYVSRVSDQSHEHEPCCGNMRQGDHHRQPVKPLEALSLPTVGRTIDGRHQ